MKNQVYISGALTNASRKQFYEDIGKIVDSLGYRAYIPHLHTDPEKNPDATPKEVYDIDMEKVEGSCLIIAYVGYPSLGVGAELERASAKNIPIILLYQKEERISRLALGVPSVKEIISFDEEGQALERLEQIISQIAP